MNHRTRLSFCLSLLLLAGPRMGLCSEEAVENNVSYASVTALGFTPASVKRVYGDADPQLQYGLLWLPANPDGAQKAPLVVLVHGGCWLNAYDIRHTFPLSSALAEAGYAVWSLEYRRTGDAGGGWPGSSEDVKAGLAFASTLTEYPLDLDRMVIVGHSAGGHLALLAAFGSPRLAGVVGLAAITDIVAYSRGTNDCQTATLDFMGGTYEQQAAAYAAANPVGKPLPGNTILLQGDIDTIVPVAQAHVPGAVTEVYAGAGHFDWIHPGTGAYGLLLSTLEKVFKP